MAAPDWSSLPADLVNRVAGCLLATNDLDCYTDLRAVCRNWRSSTDDPRSKSGEQDPRFRPSRWVMLDERKVSSGTTTDGPFLFVNTATGRFLYRRLALLSDPDHAFITSTTDGLLVLATWDSPHAVSVLNPFTGSLIRFAAPLPRDPEEALFTAVVVGSSPTLVLFSYRKIYVYWADPQNEFFSSSNIHKHFPASRVPQIIAVAGPRAAQKRCHAPVAQNVFDQFLSSLNEGNDCFCYVVEVASGDILAVKKLESGGDFRSMDVFRIDAAGNVMERVKSIGNQALFLGARCLVVEADRFLNVEPNCAYFQQIGYAKRYIHKFNIGTCDREDEPELVSVAMDSACDLPCSMCPFKLTQILNNNTMDDCPPWHDRYLVSTAMSSDFTTSYMGPFTLIQISNYTVDIPGHFPSWKSCSSVNDVDYYDEYIGYI